MSMSQEEINVSLFDEVKKLQAELAAAKAESKAITAIFYGGEIPSLPDNSIVWRMAADLVGLRREKRGLLPATGG